MTTGLTVTTNGIASVSFTDANTGTAVVDQGTILCTTTGGVTWAEEKKSVEIAEEYKLFQNCPNPFNPTTVIGYHLPAGQAGLPVVSEVTLKIYDVLGREVATLVNEDQSAGWKEVWWNAASVSSGIYFYKLTAGNFIETKKIWW